MMTVKIPLVLNYMTRLGALDELQPYSSRGMAISFPIPQSGRQRRLNFFLYPSSALTALKSCIDRPQVWVSMSATKFTVLRIASGEKMFADLKGEFPVTVSHPFDVEDEFELNTFYSIYETVLNLYPEPQSQFLKERFGALFNRFVPKPLLPFYRALNPDFFNWISQNSVRISGISLSSARRRTVARPSPRLIGGGKLYRAKLSASNHRKQKARVGRLRFNKLKDEE